MFILGSTSFAKVLIVFFLTKIDTLVSTKAGGRLDPEQTLGKGKQGTLHCVLPN